jgi:hypothetical protein
MKISQLRKEAKRWNDASRGEKLERISGLVA